VGSEPLRASVELAEGMIAAASGEHDRARPLLEDAIDRFERGGGPFDAAVARIELARTLLALGRAADAQREAVTAMAQLRELGAEHEAKRAQRLLDGTTRSADATSTLQVLTPREREVLGLVAEGLTNRQIAERLMVSEHTVHRHVTNLLRKLDLPSRTAAAALAARLEPLEKRPE
jgi:RNA polymerase sigma factor (sigma-70 family)